MNNIVITEMRLAARLLQTGILKYFNENELRFYMTDLCFEAKPTSFNNDKAQAKMLVGQGLLEIVSLDDIQMKRIETLYHKYKPKFVVKTLSAMVYAAENGYKLLSEDELLRQIACDDFKIGSHNKDWLVTTLIYDLTSQGIQIDLSMLRQFI